VLTDSKKDCAKTLHKVDRTHPELQKYLSQAISQPSLEVESIPNWNS